MIGAEFLPHPLHPRPIGVRLEGGRFEILLVVGVVKGIGLQGRQSPLPIGIGRHGGDDGGIQPAGEQGTQGHVTDQLPPDG